MNPQRSWHVCFQANFQKLLCGDVGWKIWSEMSNITGYNKKSQELGTAHCESPTSMERISHLNETNSTRSILFQTKSSGRIHTWQKSIQWTFICIFKGSTSSSLNKWVYFPVSMTTVCLSELPNEMNGEKWLCMVNWFPVLYPHHTALFHSKVLSGLSCIMFQNRFLYCFHIEH